ncbi:MAG: DUF4012 domain-containing protein [Candidatus Magasanikbacteria bacterium]|nr:DUF4012 domain-containing protein [Candidatus Magasanikbacteria bacterium]
MHTRAARTCSICGKSGHNTRTCMVFTVATAPKVEKKKISAAYVAVHVAQDVARSPHILELAKKDMSLHWNGIDVYREKIAEKNTREVINFADAIMRANTQTQVILAKETLKAYTEPKVDVDILSEIAKIGVVEPEFQFTKKQAAQVSCVGKNRERTIFFVSVIRSIMQIPQHMHGKMLQMDAVIKEKFSIKRFAISALVLLVLITLPFPAFGYYKKLETDTSRIVLESTHAFLSLQSSTVAAFEHNIPQAQYDLNTALNAFSTAEEIIDKEYKALVYVTSLLPVVGTKVSSRQKLLEAGHDLALGNTYLVKGIAEASGEGDATLVDRLSVLQQHIISAVPKYEAALRTLEQVDPKSIPVEYQESFGDFKQLFDGFIADMHDMDKVINGVELLMGSEGFRRYLVMFQNTHELRATGGFAGSFAVIDVENGKIQHIDVPGGGTYDVKGQLNVFVKPPLPLQIVNNRWEFQDANWFPDFPASAKKMAWFYQHARNSTVDGVIAVNSSVLERVLSVMGPIENKDYKIILDGETALEKLQYEVETYDNVEENTPKAILSVLLNQLIERIKEIEPHQVIGLVEQLHQSLEQREIQFYFRDEDVEQIFRDYGWTGEMIQTDENQDYLMVVNTNLGGSKSDARMRQKVYHQASIEADGSIVDTVIITRYHEGGDAHFFDAANASYLRIYVPEGSTLLDAGGFVYPEESAFSVPLEYYLDDADLTRLEQEVSMHVGSGTRVTNEFGKTTFANWIVTRPTQETQVYFTYKLPFRAFEIDASAEEQKLSLARVFDSFTGDEELSSYSIIAQKQSGSRSDLSHTVIYPENWRPVWKVGDELELSINGASVETPFDVDKVYGVIMKQIK